MLLPALIINVVSVWAGGRTMILRSVVVNDMRFSGLAQLGIGACGLFLAASGKLGGRVCVQSLRIGSLR